MKGRLALWGTVLAAACGGRHPPSPPVPATPFRFQVIGSASPADTGAPTLTIDSLMVTIRGVALQTDGVGLYGDLDLSEPHTVRLTLYDSLPGRPVDDPLPPAEPSHRRQVLYEARIGPLPPGGYDVWIGRFDPVARVVEVSHQPLHIDLTRASGRPRPKGDSGH